MEAAATRKEKQLKHLNISKMEGFIMPKRFAIWNKKDDIITSAGKVYTADEWKDKYPAAKREDITILCSYGEVNGGFFGTLGQMVAQYETEGCDFSACKTDEDKLAAIEAFLDAREAAEREAAEEMQARENMQADSLASIAASLEFQNLMQAAEV